MQIASVYMYEYEFLLPFHSADAIFFCLFSFEFFNILVSKVFTPLQFTVLTPPNPTEMQPQCGLLFRSFHIIHKSLMPSSFIFRHGQQFTSHIQHSNSEMEMQKSGKSCGWPDGEFECNQIRWSFVSHKFNLTIPASISSAVLLFRSVFSGIYSSFFP